MALVTYPLNNIEYSAEDAELFHVTRTSGIYANNSFNYSVSGADNAVVIGTGIGWIKNSEFSGKVIALKEAISLDMGLPDSFFPRIDAIIIQFDANSNETNIVVKKGTAASTPVAPSVVQTESIYELHLYHVRREAGSLYITPGNIADLRLNSSYCGLMADSVTNIDTTAIEGQVADLIESLQNEISNVIDGSAYLLRDGSANMTGNLPMDGHKVTSLGTPTADGDAVPLGYANRSYRASNWTPSAAEVGAAPAGYGLGTIGRTIKTSAELDALVVNYNFLYAGGNFDDSITIDGYTITYGYGRMDTYDATGGKQTLIPLVPRIDTTLVRYLVNGVWGEWEWENPPMSPNVEYRTTERHNGKVVYTKLVQFGTLPNNTEKSVTAMPAGASLIEAVGYASGASYNVAIPGYYGIQSIGSTRNTGALWLSTTIDMSGYSGWITIKYHKG